MRVDARSQREYILVLSRARARECQGLGVALGLRNSDWHWAAGKLWRRSVDSSGSFLTVRVRAHSLDAGLATSMGAYASGPYGHHYYRDLGIFDR